MAGRLTQLPATAIGADPGSTSAAWAASPYSRSTNTGATMPVWKQPISIEVLTAMHVGTAVAHLGIEFLEVGDDFIRARVPVDTRTKQPYGLLHGGVSVVL